MSDIKRPRRYYLLARLAAQQLAMPALEGTWRAKQEDQPGTALPAGFPSKTDLENSGYTALEDVDGADTHELARTVGLDEAKANAVIKAAAAFF